MLQFQLIDPRTTDISADALLVGVFADSGLTKAALECDRACGGALSRALERGDASAKLGTTTRLLGLVGMKVSRIILVGLGEQNKLDAARFLKALHEAAKSLKTGPIKSVASFLATVAVNGREGDWTLRQHIVAFAQQTYRYTATRGNKTAEGGLQSLQIAFDPSASIRSGEAIAAGIALTRELGNLPPNICTPLYLADTAKRLATEHPGLSTEILDRDDMHKLGMGALLGVARGSSHPPKFIIMKYQGIANSDENPYVLVGKGVTFDTGGISIKPGSAMDEMKYDMCGGAAVFGTMVAVSQMALPLNVMGLVPAVENMLDGDAYRPGDVLTSMSGQTIEILNTDAEGRLILCDAISYAKRFNPRAIVDIATLTGACVVALGKHAHGLMTHDDGLAAELLKAGETVHDRAWRLPIWEDYQIQLDSGFADMANIGGKQAGAITAGCFLSRFATEMRWAHLDIAGTAWEEGRKGGATGRPVNLLVQWLMDQAAA